MADEVIGRVREFAAAWREQKSTRVEFYRGREQPSPALTSSDLDAILATLDAAAAPSATDAAEGLRIFDKWAASAADHTDTGDMAYAFIRWALAHLRPILAAIAGPEAGNQDMVPALQEWVSKPNAEARKDSR